MAGVLELVPSEIDRLKVPYINVPDVDISELNEFVKSHSVDEILKQQDEIILSTLGVDEKQVQILQNALTRIKNRRQRITEPED